MNKKLTSSHGFSISEMLMAVLILGLVTSVIAGGVTVVRDAYINITLKANAQTLLSTAISAVTDEFRNAQNIEPEDSEIWFDNLKRGYRMTLVNDGNEIKVKTNVPNTDKLPIITDKTNTDGLKVLFSTEENTKLSFSDNCFHFSLVVIGKDGKQYASQTMTIRPLNN